jgi:hypothetical protein
MLKLQNYLDKLELAKLLLKRWVSINQIFKIITVMPKLYKKLYPKFEIKTKNNSQVYKTLSKPETSRVNSTIVNSLKWSWRWLRCLS